MIHDMLFKTLPISPETRNILRKWAVSVCGSLLKSLSKCAVQAVVLWFGYLLAADAGLMRVLFCRGDLLPRLNLPSAFGLILLINLLGYGLHRLCLILRDIKHRMVVQ